MFTCTCLTVCKNACSCKTIDVNKKSTLVSFDKEECSQPRERPYLEACEHVGSAAHLSKREQDVLNLLARSRGSDDIAKRLSISNNTVRIHTHNIYNKLNVHSRQELIEVVEKVWMSKGAL